MLRVGVTDSGLMAKLQGYSVSAGIVRKLYQSTHSASSCWLATDDIVTVGAKEISLSG